MLLISSDWYLCFLNEDIFLHLHDKLTKACNWWAQAMQQNWEISRENPCSWSSPVFFLPRARIFTGWCLSWYHTYNSPTNSAWCQCSREVSNLPQWRTSTAKIALGRSSSSRTVQATNEHMLLFLRQWVVLRWSLLRLLAFDPWEPHRIPNLIRTVRILRRGNWFSPWRFLELEDVFLQLGRLPLCRPRFSPPF